MGKTKKPSEPGLIRVRCLAPDCSTIHRIPVHLDFNATVNDEGGLDIEIMPPKPDISEMADHLAFKHGIF